jgi:serine/threonine-protein kinase
MSRGPQGFTKLLVLKIMRRELLGEPELLQMFLEEARISARLAHPNIVHVFEVGEHEGCPCIVMEYLEGQPLSSMLVRAPEKPPLALHLQVLAKALTGLHAAHELRDYDGTSLKLVHRDVSPHNVFVLFDGQVKVLDFGIAKVMSDDRQVPALTAVGQTLGTLEFMSPEQLRGQKLDGRSDIYALGMMAYEMLTGKLPFQSAKTPIDIINFHMKTQAPAPSRLAEDLAIPAAVDAIIVKMVEKDREDRFANANALREEIARAQRSLDRTPDKFEAYRLLGVIGAVVIVVATLVYFLHR